MIESCHIYLSHVTHARVMSPASVWDSLCGILKFARSRGAFARIYTHPHTHTNTRKGRQRHIPITKDLQKRSTKEMYKETCKRDLRERP